MMQDVHMELHPGLPWQKQHLTRQELHQLKQTELKFKKKKIVEGYIWSTALCGAKP